MAAQSTVAGLSMVIASAVAFSWKSTDAMDMERQRAMRHSMTGKVRLPTRTTHYLDTQIWKGYLWHWCALGLAPYSRTPWLAPHLPALTSALAPDHSIPKAMTSWSSISSDESRLSPRRARSRSCRCSRCATSSPASLSLE